MSDPIAIPFNGNGNTTDSLIRLYNQHTGIVSASLSFAVVAGATKIFGKSWKAAAIAGGIAATVYLVHYKLTTPNGKL